MTEIQHPGVYVEETPQGPRPIKGVDTSTPAFLGRTEFGPTEPTLVTSLREFTETFGGAAPGFLPDAVALFFANGGRRAVVVRVDDDYAAALETLSLSKYGDVTLVYAPDAYAVPDLVALLVADCERTNRFLVLDAPQGAVPPLDPRSVSDSDHAAYYFPWLRVGDPDGRQRLVPPGGAVLGVYARVDRDRGVWKSPANEVVIGAVGLAHDVAADDQDALAAAGANTIRTFPGRGIRVWGARTLSTAGEWSYVSVRRFVSFLERSIAEGTRWVVFEPNDEPLWARVRDTIRLFLRAQWQAGAMPGRTERQAFFVTCDRTTMTQDDIDDGRLICEIGIAPVRPAEFVVVRIGLWTARDDP